MTDTLWYSALLDKQLAGLRKTGKKAELAVNKYEAILNDIRRYGCQHESVFSKRTRHGEARIKNCVKYDLGGGYQLITIRVDCHLFICFVGNHDEADKWIEHHRYDILVPGDAMYRCEQRADETTAAETRREAEGKFNDEGEDSYEDSLRARLDERHLKTIFRGLFPSTASSV